MPVKVRKSKCGTLESCLVSNIIPFKTKPILHPSRNIGEERIIRLIGTFRDIICISDLNTLPDSCIGGITAVIASPNNLLIRIGGIGNSPIKNKALVLNQSASELRSEIRSVASLRNSIRHGVLIKCTQTIRSFNNLQSFSHISTRFNRRVLITVLSTAPSRRTHLLNASNFNLASYVLRPVLAIDI